MAVLHDIRCLLCDAERCDVMIESGRFPKCHACGGDTTWIPRTLHTDLHDQPIFNHATGRSHKRTRDAELEVARQCRAYSEQTGIHFEAHLAGDPVGGARTDTRLKDRGYSYGGQGSRRSSAEHARKRDGNHSRARAAYRAPVHQMDRQVNGVSPGRMTKDQAQEMRRSPTWRQPTGA